MSGLPEVKPSPGAGKGWFDPAEGPLTEFTEALLLGVLWFLLCLPVVTVGPATITVLAIRRRQREGCVTSAHQAWESFLASWRSGWLLSVAAIGCSGAILLEIHVARAGALPGGAVLSRVLVIVLVAVLTGLLLIAGQEAAASQGLTRSTAAAFELCLERPALSLGLFGAVAAVALLCTIQPALLCFAVGPLLHATDATTARRAPIALQASEAPQASLEP